MSVVALICLLAGLGFLTSALWMVLAAWQGGIFAAQVLGFGYCAVALILFAFARLTMRPPGYVPRTPRTPAPGEPDPLVTVIEGFLMGLDAGRRSARSRR